MTAADAAVEIITINGMRESVVLRGDLTTRAAQYREKGKAQ